MIAKDFDPRRMTDEELEALLREEHDDELLLQAAEEYAGRLGQQGVEIPDAKDAWAEFRTHYMPAEMLLAESTGKRAKVPGVRRIWRRVASVAAAVAIGLTLLTITAYAAGVPLWDILIDWTGDRFYIVWEDDITPGVPAVILEKYGVTEEAVPSWVPERYELLSYRTTDAFGTTVVSYGFEYTDFLFSVSPVNSNALHQPSGNGEVYRTNGIQYYIFRNFKQTEIIWAEGGCECCLQGEFDVTQFKKILNNMN